MKKMLAVLALIGLLGITGCTHTTEYGTCVGVQDLKKENPKLEYEVTTWNIVWTIIGSGSLIPIAVFFLADFECPTGYAPAAK